MNETRTTIIGGREVVLHSQPETEQDAWVLRTLKNKERGTFIEVGAYDGVYHSNTLTLEESFGWTGWLIEAVPEYADSARVMRSASVINNAIGTDYTSVHFYVAGQWSGLKGHIRPNLVAGHLAHNNPVARIFTVPLASSLRCCRTPRVVDYLSIDVEGAEYPILKEYFRNPPTHFRCMTVEVGVGRDDLDKLVSLLEPHGYELCGARAWEAYFVNTKLI